MNPRPPGLASRLIERVLRDDAAGGSMLGDLQEDFVSVARRRGAAAARRWYWREALLLAVDRGARRQLRSLSALRTMTPSALLRGLLQDWGYALRAVRRNPGFVLFTGAVIGIGVGATTSVFSVVKPLLLAPLPFADAARLVWIGNEAEPGDNSLSAITSRSGNLRDFRELSRSFVGVTGYNAFFAQSAYTLAGAGETERLVGAGVADDFLQVLGVEPVRGRAFSAEEGRWGGPRAVILSHAFWQRRFLEDAGVVGRVLELNGEPHTVVGVLPATFDFSSVFSPGVRVDFLLPFPVSPETDRYGNTMIFIGRLRPGVSAAEAQNELDAIVSALQEAQPNRWGLGARVEPLQDHIAAPFRPALLLLAAAAGTVLLIVCVNVSNLLLARSTRRLRELAVRRALGASRARVMRQLVLETLAIAIPGVVIGWGLAWLTTSVIAGNAGIRIPLLDRVQIDGAALLFGTLVAVLTGLVVGLVPAFQIREGGESAVLRASGRGSSGGRGARRLREALVIGQVTLAFVLLVLSGLLVRSYRAVLDIDLGFDAANVVAWQLNPSPGFESRREESDFYTALAARVREVPGVEEVGLIDALPLGRNRTWPFSVAGVPESEDTDDEIFPHIVNAGYLPAMHIPVLAGRNFTRYDTGDTGPVVMINEAGARRVFGGADALGRRIQLWDEREWEIVGVVKDVRHVSPELDSGIQVYFPLTQMRDFQTLDLAVRSRRPLDQVTDAVAAALREIDPVMPTREFWTVQSTVDRALSARHFTLSVLTGYGAVAVFLAALGIYAVLAHSVVERRPEIGVRMALGASSREIVRIIIGRVMFLAGVGILAGVVLSLSSASLLQSLLYGVSAVDPLTFVSMAFILLLISAAAAAVPAARALRTAAVRALAAE